MCSACSCCTFNIVQKVFQTYVLIICTLSNTTRREREVRNSYNTEPFQKTNTLLRLQRGTLFGSFSVSLLLLEWLHFERGDRCGEITKISRRGLHAVQAGRVNHSQIKADFNRWWHPSLLKRWLVKDSPLAVVAMTVLQGCWVKHTQICHHTALHNCIIAQVTQEHALYKHYSIH